MSKLAQQMSGKIQPGMKVADKKASTSTAECCMACGGKVKPAMKKSHGGKVKK